MLQNNINEMIRDYRENNNQDAFEMILKQYDRMIHRIIKNINNIEKDDLYSIAMIGFMKAINTFDESRGNQFNTYLYRVVTNEVYMEIRKTKFEKEYDIISADKTVSNSEEENLNVINTIPSDVNIEEETIENEEYQWLYNTIDKFAEKNEMKGQVIKLLIKGMKQEDISKIVGCSRSYCSRIQTQFIAYAKAIA